MLPVEIAQWAVSYGIPAHALSELAMILGAASTAPASTGAGSEARVQSQVRLGARARGMQLYRNNVGALLDKRGVPVRFGLCNDTKALNDQFKSSDLIGWRAVIITQAMVGCKIAQVVTLEIKEEGWVYRGDPHEMAQLRWIMLVNADGGYGKFVSRVEDM